MKKLILIGRSGSGKTTLTQALKKEPTTYHKTQYVSYGDFLIDTPGEYLQNAPLAAALALYAYEADVVGLLLAATEDYSMFPPNCTCMVNREVVGIVTKIDAPDANPERAAAWLRLSGCQKIFFVNSVTGEGVDAILSHLKS